MDDLEVMDFDDFVRGITPKAMIKNDTNSVFSSYNSETGKNEPPKVFNKEDNDND